MSTIPAQAPAPHIDRLFTRGRKIWLVLLIAAVALCAGFAWRTRDSMAHLSFLKAGSKAQAVQHQNTLVDLSPWLTAEALTPLAVSREEKEDAHTAEHLADHDVDQAFAAALRTAEMQRPVLTPAAKALTERVEQLQAAVKQDKAQLATLKPDAASSNNDSSDPQSDDIDIAKAQLGLDSDELDDAQQDLAAAVGDHRARIQQELAAHEALMQKYDSQSGDLGEVAVISSQRNTSLSSRIAAWYGQRSRYALLQQAQQDALTRAAALTSTHQTVKAKETPQSDAGPQDVNSPSPAISRLADLKSRTLQRQLLSILNDRILTEQQLAAVYAKWSAQITLQHRIVLHLILRSLALIAFLLLCQFLLDLLISYWTGRPGLDQRRLHTMRTILRVTAQLICLGIILIIIFGKPQQISTIVGLATAGLTVALQSYILAFCGWFVLMGRHGMRVGDAVEIDGVGGEVAEIGLFRTTLLETGNWTANGHPTGRRVTFMNNFAVTGRFFNFSTVGQWMWDELTLSIPATSETYSAIESIHRAVAKETEAEARGAESEWKSSGRGHALSKFTAEPTVNLRPASSGVDVIIRYITRASRRLETRNHLYQAVLEVLHQSPQPEEPPQS